MGKGAVCAQVEQDIKVGLGLGAGHTNEKTGELFDISRRTVINHSRCPLALQVRAWASLVLSSRIEARAEAILNKDDFLKGIRKLRPDVLRLYQKTISQALASDGDIDPKLLGAALKAGDMALDRDPETAKTQKHEHSGEVVERQIYQIDPETIRVLSQAARETRLIDSGTMTIEGEILDESAGL